MLEMLTTINFPKYIEVINLWVEEVLKTPRIQRANILAHHTQIAGHQKEKDLKSSQMESILLKIF